MQDLFSVQYVLDGEAIARSPREHRSVGEAQAEARRESRSRPGYVTEVRRVRDYHLNSRFAGGRCF